MKIPLLGMALALLSVVALAAPPTPTVTFRGTTYSLSLTNGNRYDFMPAEQKESSFDALTLLLLARIKDGEALADLANRTLTKLQGVKATILRTNSVPASAQKPAEHFMAVVIPGPDALQFAASRYVLVVGEGVEVIYMHTIHGKAVGDPMSKWMKENGPDVEQQLMQFDVAHMVSLVNPQTTQQSSAMTGRKRNRGAITLNTMCMRTISR